MACATTSTRDHREHDYISNFDLANAKILVANKDGVGRTAGVKTDWTDIAPRVVRLRDAAREHGAARRWD
jgi:hypothetical protein